MYGKGLLSRRVSMVMVYCVGGVYGHGLLCRRGVYGRGLLCRRSVW